MKGRSSNKPIAYAPFGTFLAVLDRLTGIRRGDILDKRRCDIRYDASWEQLRRSLRALELVDEEDRATVALTRLINKNRQSELHKILQGHYPEVFDGDPTRLGRAKLERMLTTKYGLTGATVGKARSFLLGALRYCGVRVSPELSRMTRHRVEKKRRFEAYDSNSGKDKILSHTAHDMTLTVAILPGSWPEVEPMENELINRLFEELLSFKKRTTKSKRPHLTSVKS